MRRFLVAAMALVILGAALPARAENEGSGVYVGFVTHTLAADADLTAATETLRDGTTGALIPPIKDLLADPDLSFDAKLQEAGSGVRFGFNRAFSERFGVDLYGELGAVRSAFPLRENDAGGPKSKFSANAFDDDAFYFSLGAGIFGELPVEVGGGPMSWTARVAFSMNDNAVLNDSDTSGPLQEIESEIKYSAVMVEGTIGLAFRETRLFLALTSVNSDITFSEVDTDMGAGPTGEEQTVKYEAQWSSGLVLSIGAEASMEGASVFFRLHLTGASGGSAGIMWRF